MAALEWTLSEYASDMPDKFAEIDKDAFLAGVESAVGYMHSLGLATTTSAPITLWCARAEDGSCTPVLIDMGSSGPFGGRILGGGSKGFADPEDPNMFVSLKSHDEYSLDRVPEWWDAVLDEAQEGPAKEEPGKDGN